MMYVKNIMSVCAEAGQAP